MYIGWKAWKEMGSSVKRRHLKIDILPMNWKPPNQKVEMGRNAAQYGTEKGAQRIPMAKYTYEFPRMFTLKPEEAIIWLCLPITATTERWVTICQTVRKVGFLNLSKYLKTTLGSSQELWGWDHQKEFWGEREVVPWAIHVLGHPGENRKREAKGRLRRAGVHSWDPSVWAKGEWRKFYISFSNPSILPSPVLYVKEEGGRIYFCIFLWC